MKVVTNNEFWKYIETYFIVPYELLRLYNIE